MHTVWGVPEPLLVSPATENHSDWWRAPHYLALSLPDPNLSGEIEQRPLCCFFSDCVNCILNLGVHFYFFIYFKQNVTYWKICFIPLKEWKEYNHTDYNFYMCRNYTHSIIMPFLLINGLLIQCLTKWQWQTY